ncbi:hypothetical protein Tco_0795747 [Tanacetum coccineum]
MQLELILVKVNAARHKLTSATVKAKTVNRELQLQALVDWKKIIITESTVRRDLQLEDAEGVDCLPNATIFEQQALAGPKTTAWNEFSSTMAYAIICLATNQKFNFSKFIFESMVKNLDNVDKILMYPRPKKKDAQVPQSSVPSDNDVDEAFYKELDDSLVRVAMTAFSLEAEQDSGGGLRRQETMGDTIAQTRSENVSKLSNDPLLARETTKTTQGNEIASLKRRVKKLENKDRSRTHKLKRLYKVGLSARAESSRDEEDLGEDASKQGRRIHDIDADKDITLVNDDNEIFDVDALAGDEVFVAEQSENVVEEIVDAAQTITIEEITLAQALAELKSAKLKASRDKDKGIMIEEPMVEQVKPMKRLEQIWIDKELAFKLQAEEEEEERLAKEKAQQVEEANIAWDDVQDKVEVDYQLAQRLQAQEQEKLIDEEKARLFVQCFEQRKKIAAKRAEEKRNRPPTRA